MKKFIITPKEDKTVTMTIGSTRLFRKRTTAYR